MKFSFVIPTINAFEMLFDDCIDSLVAKNGSEHEIIIVEDGSPQPLQTKIGKECVARGIRYFIHPNNLGFPKTVNEGMRAATGDVVVLVNNDIQFTHNVVEPIEKCFSLHDRIGIVGALLLYPHGTIQHGGIISTHPGMFTHRGWHKNLEHAPEVHTTDYMIGVTGALFAIRKEVISDVGYMNEDFFLSCDDTEYCLRTWQKDWRVLYSDTVRAIHAEGATRGANDPDKIRKSRHWYIQERKTIQKFTETFSERFNMEDLHRKVRDANVVKFKPPPPPPSHECEVKRYGVWMTGIEMEDQKEKIANAEPFVVRRTGALGDVLLSTGVIRILKEMNPDNPIWVCTICPEVFRGNPNVSNVVRNLADVPTNHRFFDLDMAYESSPKMHIIEAYARKIFQGVPLRGEKSLPELFSNQSDYDLLCKKMVSIRPNVDRVAVLHMSMSWPSRTWPQDKWNRVASALVDQGFKVAVIGRGADFQGPPGVSNLVNQLTIHEIRELCKKASVFVGIDSGMLHVAMTTDCPVVGMFTVANPDYRIVKRDAKTLCLIPKVECRFCLHEQPPPVQFVACKYSTNHCLDEFQPDKVVSSALEIAR